MKNIVYLLAFLSTILLSNAAQAQFYDCPDEIFPRQDKATRLWGYKDITGTWRVQPVYIKAYAFEGKNAVVIQGKKYGVVDCEGRIMVSGYDEFASFVWGKGWGRVGDKWALVDDKGRQLIPPTYSSVREVSPRGTLTWVQKDNKWGLISKENGRFIIPQQYDTYLSMSDSAAIVRQANVFKVIEYSRGEVIQDNISAVIQLSPAFFAFRRNNKWGVVNNLASLTLRPDSDTLWKIGDYIYATEAGKIGLHTFTGREVLPREYEEIGAFSEGLARVKKGGKYGFTTISGKIIVPIVYDEAETVKNYQTIVRKGNLYGVWNARKNSYTIPLEHELIRRNYGYEFYAVTTQGKAYFTSLEGQKLNKEAFDSIYVNDDIVKMRVRDKGKFKFYNAQLLRYTSELTFEEARPYSLGFACVKNDNKWGVINEQGQIAVPYRYDQAPEYLSVAYNKQLFKVMAQGNYGVCDAAGKELLAPQYELITPSEQKLFKVKQKGKYGLIKLSGEVVLPPTYNAMSNGQENPSNAPEFPAIVLKGKKYGLINFKGEEILAPAVEMLRYMGEGFYATQEKQQYGIVSAQGKEIITPEYEALGQFNDRIASAKKDGKWGFVNMQGKWQIQPQFEEVTEFNSKSAYIKLNGKWGAITKSGNFLLPAEYDGYEILSNGARRLIKK